MISLMVEYTIFCCQKFKIRNNWLYNGAFWISTIIKYNSKKIFKKQVWPTYIWYYIRLCVPLFAVKKWEHSRYGIPDFSMKIFVFSTFGNIQIKISDYRRRLVQYMWFRWGIRSRRNRTHGRGERNILNTTFHLMIFINYLSSYIYIYWMIKYNQVYK